MLIVTVAETSDANTTLVGSLGIGIEVLRWVAFPTAWVCVFGLSMMIFALLTIVPFTKARRSLAPPRKFGGVSEIPCTSRITTFVLPTSTREISLTVALVPLAANA